MSRASGLLAGLNHVAIVTADLDRFIAFYARTFGLEVVFKESTLGMRHAILRVSADSWLHPVEILGNPHAAATPKMFDRGHIDHLSLAAASAAAFERVRCDLMACSASSGVVQDLGAYHALWFEDPDGMQGELTLIVDPNLRDIHAPRPLGATSSAPIP